MEPASNYSSFLSRLNAYKKVRRSALGKEVIQFLTKNQIWINHGIENPHLGMRHSLKSLKKRITRIKNPNLDSALTLIKQQLKKTRKTSFSDIPLDVLSLILQGNPKEMGVAARVSKKFQQAADRARIIGINQNKTPLRTLFKSAEEAVNFFAGSPQKDQIHYLDFAELPLNNTQFKKLLENCPHLTYLNVEGSAISGDVLQYLAHVKGLRLLNIRFCHQLEPDALKHLAHVKDLNSLEIIECIQLESDGLKHLVYLKKLRSLSMGFCTGFEADTLKHLAHVKDLNSLDITGCRQLEPDALKHLVHVKGLSSLNIEGCHRLEVDALKHLAHVKDLSSLNIANCWYLEPDALKHLVHVKDLSSLNINFCRRLEADALKHLAHVKDLNSLDISLCRQLDRSYVNSFHGTLLS